MSARVFLASAPEGAASAAHLHAVWVCGHVCRDLGLAEVAVRWLSPTHEEETAPTAATLFYRADDFCGLVNALYPGTIFLRVGLLLPQIVVTVAHECRHLWQAATYGNWEDWWCDQSTEGHRADQEADADAYAEQFARDLGWWGVEVTGG